MLYQRLGNRDLLQRGLAGAAGQSRLVVAQPATAMATGMVEYGTSPVGGGLYRGTKLAAKDESSMDNSPTHDEATLNTKSWTLDSADVGLNSLLALDGEMLALIAARAGRDGAKPSAWPNSAKALKARIADQLWDPERKVFANRLLVRRIRAQPGAAPASIRCSAAPPRPSRPEAMVAHAERSRANSAAQWLLPSVTRDDPAFPDNVYWRGRIWPPLNFLVYQGLKRAGFPAEASQLAENGFRLFQRRVDATAAIARRITMPSAARPSISPIPIPSMAGAR